jgi:hypothetical protein
MNSENLFLIIALVVGAVAVSYLVYTQMTQTTTTQPMVVQEGFASPAPADQVSVGGVSGSGEYQTSVQGSEDIQYIEQPQGLGQMDDGTTMNQLPSECYPKDVLSSADLLPRDANSLWAQVNPSGQGSLADQNFLTAGFHIGINTVGQTLRNANRQLRSEPLNPQVKVSPWLQSTIEPDINRRPLEIQGDL